MEGKILSIKMGSVAVFSGAYSYVFNSVHRLNA